MIAPSCCVLSSIRALASAYFVLTRIACPDFMSANLKLVTRADDRSGHASLEAMPRGIVPGLSVRVGGSAD